MENCNICDFIEFDIILFLIFKLIVLKCEVIWFTKLFFNWKFLPIEKKK